MGGCKRCMQLLEIHHNHKKTLSLLKHFGPLRESKPKPKSKTVDHSMDDRQTSLFQY